MGTKLGFRVPGIYTALKPASAALNLMVRFRVPGIYTALKRSHKSQEYSQGFRVPGIYTALKQKCCGLFKKYVLEYLEFTQLSNTGTR